MKIYKIMRRDVKMVHPETTIGEVIDLMIAHDVAGLPVVDHDTRLVGWIPESRLLDRSLSEAGYTPPTCHPDGLHFVRQQRNLYARTAADLMVPRDRVVAIQDFKDVTDAVQLMLEKNVSRLPVLRGENVIGYLTRADILKAVRHREFEWSFNKVTDDDIRRIGHEALRRCSHVDKSNVHMSVESGVIRVIGTVGSPEEIKHLEMLFSEIPGVRGVANILMVDRMLV